MDRDVERAIVARVLEHVGARTTDQMATEGRVAASDYLSPSRFEAERALLRRLPRVLGPSAALPSPGDFFTTDDHGIPILVTRDRSGRARAFVNACRHRGTRLVSEASGRGRANFACPYHAWVYGGDGRLLKIAHDATCFPGVDRERLGLIELPAGERLGFVWGLADPNASLDLDAFFGPIAAEIDALGLATHAVYRPDVRDWRANWKVFVDGGLESYHFRSLHRRTIAPSFFDNLAVYDRFGPHQRHVLPRRSIEALAGADPSSWRLRPNTHFVYYLFPTTLLLVQPDHVALVAIYPRAPGESRIIITMLVPELPADEKATGYWEKNRHITLETLAEDFAIGERADEGLRSGALGFLTLGRNEPGIADFHESLDEALASTVG